MYQDLAVPGHLGCTRPASGRVVVHHPPECVLTAGMHQPRRPCPPQRGYDVRMNRG